MSSVGANTNADIQDKKNYALRNGTYGAITGAVVGGGIGYYTTKIAHGGIPTDKFVHNIVKEHLINHSDGSIMKEIKLDISLDKIKELTKKDVLTQDELKSFLEKNKNFFKKDLEQFKNGNADEITAKFNKVLNGYNKNFNYIKDQLVKSYDASKKMFNYAAMDTKLSELSKHMEKAFKLVNTAKIGAIAAIGLGALTYIATKIQKN